MKRFLRRLVFALLVLVLVIVAGVGVAKFVLSRPAPKPGEPPRGYSSRREIVAAYALGDVKLVNMNPPLPAGVVERKDVEYGRVGERSLQLDLYSPRELSKPAPALIFIHGGGWKSGKRSDYRVYTTYFASLGYVTATISYRLVPEAAFPAAVEDAKRAVRWLRDNAERLHLDPERIAVLGGSAGGHLALMVGCSAGVPELEGRGGHAGVSSRVAAVVDLYGPADFTTPFAQTSSLVKDFLGGRSFAEAPELYRQASPLFQVKAGAPPTLILHGTIDETVPVEQSDTLAAKLTELGVPHEYLRLDGWPHTMDAAQPVNDYCKARIAAFLAKYLGAPN